MGKIIMPEMVHGKYYSEDFEVGDTVRLWLDYGARAVNLRQGVVLDPRKECDLGEKLMMSVELTGWTQLWGTDSVVVDDRGLGLTNHNRRVGKLPYTSCFSFHHILLAEKASVEGWYVINPLPILIS
jgi:hypothetical protein